MAKLIGNRFVASDKIENYLLNHGHLKGASKARYFASFGFTRENWQLLLTSISHHPSANDVVETKNVPHGLKSVIKCSVSTPDGRDPCIITVWILLHGESVHRFVTAYKNPTTP